MRTINISNANFVRSTIYGRFIDTVRITNGVWDASTAQAQGGAAGPNNGFIGTITAEVFPTHLRATGPGFCQNLGKGLGGLAGPPLAGAFVPTLGYPLVLALPGLLMLALAGWVWLLPRVTGRELRPVEGTGYLAG